MCRIVNIDVQDASHVVGQAGHIAQSQAPIGGILASHRREDMASSPLIYRFCKKSSQITNDMG